MSQNPTPSPDRWVNTKLNHQQKFLTKALLEALPALYATEKVPSAEKKGIVHFFGGPFDLWAVEFDPEEGVFFGFVRIGNDPGEWGYTTAESILSGGYSMSLMGRSVRMPLERDLHYNGSLPEEAKR